MHTSTINESITDSSAGDYMVQIFPSGYFTYDNGYGYRGMATQVVWKGKTNHKVIANRNQTSLNQMDQKQIVSTRTAKSAFDKKLKKSKWVMPVWVWIVFAMVVLSGWGLMIIKIRKLQVSKFTFAQ
ncbi:hypothetical protein [Pedobacter sp. Leaf250]|uniref:hypothetical protein n=1 Tax=Pedobacter sp. Leaf250 TaxID=2876559 RepID=UPI001E2F8EE0|nr:hypothetical protein [Pedobacter sp. Leaf250]